MASDLRGHAQRAGSCRPRGSNERRRRSRSGGRPWQWAAARAARTSVRRMAAATRSGIAPCPTAAVRPPWHSCGRCMALDGVEKPGASGKTPAESASTISVAAMVGAASTACATVIHAAAAASAQPTPHPPAPLRRRRGSPRRRCHSATVNETASAASESAPASRPRPGLVGVGRAQKHREEDDGKAATNTRAHRAYRPARYVCQQRPSAAPRHPLLKCYRHLHHRLGRYRHGRGHAASTSDATVSAWIAARQAAPPRTAPEAG